ncbi:Protein nud1 [Tilletia horrida]|nr:Protein nud1 [Tilletia horrida]
MSLLHEKIAELATEKRKTKDLSDSLRAATKDYDRLKNQLDRTMRKQMLSASGTGDVLSDAAQRPDSSAQRHALHQSMANTQRATLGGTQKPAPFWQSQASTQSNGHAFQATPVRAGDMAAAAHHGGGASQTQFTPSHGANHGRFVAQHAPAPDSGAQYSASSAAMGAQQHAAMSGLQQDLRLSAADGGATRGGIAGSATLGAGMHLSRNGGGMASPIASASWAQNLVRPVPSGGVRLSSSAAGAVSDQRMSHLHARNSGPIFASTSAHTPQGASPVGNFLRAAVPRSGVGASLGGSGARENNTWARPREGNDERMTATTTTTTTAPAASAAAAAAALASARSRAKMDDDEHTASSLGEPALQNALAALEDFDQSELRHEEEEEEQQRREQRDRSASSQDLTRERLRYYEDQTPPQDGDGDGDDNKYGVEEHTGEQASIRSRSEDGFEEQEQDGNPLFEDAEYSRGSIPDLSAAPSVSYASRSLRRYPEELDEEEEEQREVGGPQDTEGEDAPEEDILSEEQEVLEEEGAVEQQDSSDAAEQQEQSLSGGVDATVIYNPDASLLPPILRPAWQRGSPERPQSYGQYNANSSTPHRGTSRSRSRSPAKNNAFYQDRLGGDIFSPMKLQRIFNPPTPPSVDSASPEASRAGNADAGPPQQAEVTAQTQDDDVDEAPSQLVVEDSPTHKRGARVVLMKGDTTSADEGEVEAQLGSLNKAPLFIAKTSTPLAEIPEPRISAARNSLSTDQTSPEPPSRLGEQILQRAATPERTPVQSRAATPPTLAQESVQCSEPVPQSASPEQSQATPRPVAPEQSAAHTPSMSQSKSRAGVPFTPLTPRRPMKLFSRGTPMFVFRASPSPSGRTSASRSSGESGGPRLALARGSDSSGSASQAGRFEIGTDARTPSEFVRKLQRMRSHGRLRGSAQRHPRSSIRPDRLGARRTSAHVGEALEEEDEPSQAGPGSQSRSNSGLASGSTPSPSVVRSRVLQSASRAGRPIAPVEADESALFSQREQKRLKIGVEPRELGSRRNSLEQEAVFLSRSVAKGGEAHPESSNASGLGEAESSTASRQPSSANRSLESAPNEVDDVDRGQVYLSPHAEQQAHAAWNRISMGPLPYRRDNDGDQSALNALPGMRLGVSAGPPRDYVREAPSFMQLIRQQGLGSDAMTITTTRSALGSGSGTGSGSASAAASVAASGSGPMSRTQSTNSMGMSTGLGSSTQVRGRAEGSLTAPPRDYVHEVIAETSAHLAQPANTQFSFRVVQPVESALHSQSNGNQQSELSRASKDAWPGQRYPTQFARDISEDEVDAALGGTGRDQDYHLLVTAEPRRVQSSPARTQARSPSKTVTFAGVSPRRVAFAKTIGSSGQSPRKLLRQFSAAAEVEWEIAEEEGQTEDVQVDEPEQHFSRELSGSDLVTSKDVQDQQPPQSNSPEQQIQELIERKTSSGNSDPMRKSTLVHISPEEFNMPMEALENVLGQGRMTFDRAAGKWIKIKNRSRANSETTDKRSVATSAHASQPAHSGSDSQEGLSELEAPSDEAKAKSASSRTAIDGHNSHEGVQSMSRSSNDSTPDPFKNIDSFSHSEQRAPMPTPHPHPQETSKVLSPAERSSDPVISPPTETSRNAWPRESTPPVANASPSRSAAPEAPAHNVSISVSAPYGSVKETPGQGFAGFNNAAAAAAFANRPKYSSLLRQEVKLMQSASTASSAGSDVAGQMSPARLLDVAAALAQEDSIITLPGEDDRLVPTSSAAAASTPHPFGPAQTQLQPQPSPQPSSHLQQHSPTPLKPILVSRSPTKSAMASTPRQSPSKGQNDETRRSISFADTPRASQLNRRAAADPSHNNADVNDIPHRPESPTPRRLSAAEVSIGPVSSRTLEIAQAIQHLAELTLNQDGHGMSDVGDTSVVALRKGPDVTASRRMYGGREEGAAGHLTLATNASFSVARDRIVELIADVAPWEEHWEEMDEIDLSGRRVETVLRLRDFCPALENVFLSRNELSYLTGLPSGVRVLKVADNRLSNMSLFDHLKHLEILDISGNQLTSLRNLECLSRLKDLKANDNAISDLRGLMSMGSLRRLSLRGNKLTRFDAASLDASSLERLDLSRNSIQMVASLYRLRNLRELNLDHNSLCSIDLGPKMSRLRILRLSFNPELAHLDVLPAHKLNTLYVDGCGLSKVEHLGALTGLENFSIRQQGTGAVQWRADETRDAKRLFFSGNSFHGGLLGHRPEDSDGDDASDAGRSSDSHATARQMNGRKRAHPDSSGRLRDPSAISPPIVLFTLVYLELSGCQLTVLPSALPSQLPNLRHLNLDHNLFTTLPGLQALTRLKRLSLVGCRVKSSQSILKAVQGLPELLVLDTRMNPCTLGLYPPVIVVSPLNTAASAGTSAQGRAVSLAEAALPPIPNPEVAQPDLLPHNLKKAQHQKQQERRRAEKSFFHKRSAAPDPLDDSSAEESEFDGRSSTMASSVTDGPEEPDAQVPPRKRKLERAAAAAAAAGTGVPPSSKNAPSRPGSSKPSSSATTSSALFLASDVRFLKTLPTKFIQRRQAHRGLLALGCPALTWLDGLVVEWAEVEMAQDFVDAVRADREARAQARARTTSAAAAAAGPSASAPTSAAGGSRRTSVFDPDVAERESTGRGTETEFWMPSEPRIEVAFNSLP